MKKIILTTLCCLTAALTSAREKSPVTIIMQVSDPQMGFYADNRDMAYETRTLTKTVEAINRLRPDVVVFTGDYVHNAADESQWTEFLRIVAEINPRIKTLYLPGNHDVRLLCACERDPTDRNQLGLPERRNPGPLERRESVPVAGPFAQKEKAQPDISCLRTPPVLSPANRRTGRLFDHFAGKTPEIFRTVPGNRCANRLYGTFARQRGDIVRQHRNDNHECRGPTVGRRSFGSADYCHQGSNDHPPVLSAR